MNGCTSAAPAMLLGAALFAAVPAHAAEGSFSCFGLAVTITATLVLVSTSSTAADGRRG
jgi:hypothetical protein